MTQKERGRERLEQTHTPVSSHWQFVESNIWNTLPVFKRQFERAATRQALPDHFYLIYDCLQWKLTKDKTNAPIRQKNTFNLYLYVYICSFENKIFYILYIPFFKIYTICSQMSLLFAKSFFLPFFECFQNLTKFLYLISIYIYFFSYLSLRVLNYEVNWIERLQFSFKFNFCIVLSFEGHTILILILILVDLFLVLTNSNYSFL